MNNMFTSIMSKKINGVMGRLGDLGRTSKEYDEIITTLCGTRLDSIVVRTYEAARAVIDYAKKEKLGRISCIILDQIKDHEKFMSFAFNTPKSTVRLWDMVDCPNNEVSCAFYFILGDTLYC